MDKLKPCPFCGGEALDYSSKTVQCDMDIIGGSVFVFTARNVTHTDRGC